MNVNLSIKNVNLDLLQVQYDELIKIMKDYPSSIVWGMIEMIGDALE